MIRYNKNICYKIANDLMFVYNNFTKTLSVVNVDDNIVELELEFTVKKVKVCNLNDAVEYSLMVLQPCKN
jgi:hypothetical protein